MVGRPSIPEARYAPAAVRVLPRALAALLCLSVAALSASACRDTAQPPAKQTMVTIRGQTIVAEVARTPEEQRLGLGERDGLAPGTGMVFPYAEPARHGFWMKGMRFDLDVVWIRDGRIVDIAPFVPAPRPGASSTLDTLRTFEPREPADTVLEVVAGTAQARGWKLGDEVRFEPPLR